MQLFFPRQAGNSPSPAKPMVFLFGMITLMTLGRSLAHILLPDGGANSIATLVTFSGQPDPDEIIYHLFALWGLAQLAMGLVYTLVLFRYRNLIPLMWVFVLFEYLMRLFIAQVLKPLDPSLLAGTAPGSLGNYIIPPLAGLMILLSLLNFRGRSIR